MNLIKRKRMKVLQEEFPLRKEIEHCVVSYNTILRDVVQFMSLPVLLNNCHPSFRTDYALRLFKMGVITPADVSFHKWFKLNTITNDD